MSGPFVTKEEFEEVIKNLKQLIDAKLNKSDQVTIDTSQFLKIGGASNLKVEVGYHSAAFGGTTITFPSAFSSTPYVVVTGKGEATPYVANVSTTSFTLYARGAGRGTCGTSGCRGWTTGEIYFYWIAIGGA